MNPIPDRQRPTRGAQARRESAQSESHQNEQVRREAIQNESHQGEQTRREPIRPLPYGANHGKPAPVPKSNHVRPANRKAVPPPPRATSPMAEHYVDRAEIRRQTADRKNQNRNIWTGRILVFAVCFLTIALLCGALLFVNLHLHSGVPRSTPPAADTTDAAAVLPIDPPNTEDVTDMIYDPADAYTYLTDVSDILDILDPADASPYLILVNTTHVLSENDVPSDLVDVTDTRSDRAPAQMRAVPEKALQALLKEARAAGYTDVTVTSGYRSYYTQQSLFSSYVSRELSNHPSWTREQAETQVATYSCRAGTSEHQSGLCVDMHNLPAADVRFAQTEAGQWLKENSWKFGFVVRFPEDKVEVTGISYEPWHFRFVGRTAAAQMYKQNLCLEEYVETLQK